MSVRHQTLYALAHEFRSAGDERAVAEDRQGRPRHLVRGVPYERSLRQLWAYCGLGDPLRKRARGMDADEALALGRPELKMLCFLMAEATMKQKGKGGRYRDVYELRRAVTVDRVHAVDCVRCGPSGRPKPVGTPWSPAHQFADALRVVSKEIVRDIWLAARGGTTP